MKRLGLVMLLALLPAHGADECDEACFTEKRIALMQQSIQRLQQEIRYLSFRCSTYHED